MQTIQLLAALFVAGVRAETSAAAKCSGDLLVDNFSGFASQTNSLNDAASDDQTMTSISAANGVLSFTPKDANSYFYETFPCTKAKTEGYGGLEFTLTYPAGAAFTIELQTRSDCSAANYSSEWFDISGLSGTQQVITLDLDVFGTSNLDAVSGFVFASFTEVGAYTLSNVQFVCRSLNPQKRRATSGPDSADTSDTDADSELRRRAAECKDLVIDDWVSQSRLTFLYYNSMIHATSDDGSMASIVVSNNNTVTLTPQSKDSYFYSEMPCVDTESVYGGISLRMKAKRGTTFSVQLSSQDQCGSGNYTRTQTLTTAQLGWTFDGTIRAYSFPLTRFPDVDASKVSLLFLASLTGPVTLGPMAFYCGTRPSEVPAPAHPVNAQTQFKVAAPASTSGGTLLIDNFATHDSNALGQWHGCDQDCVTWTLLDASAGGGVRLQTNNSDLGWYSSLADKCADLTAFKDSYLHIAYSGSNKFTVALQQANADCNPDVAPFPETWDSLEAARYANAAGTDMYMPLSHFNIDLRRAVAFAFKGFYTTEVTTLRRIEIVPAVPRGFAMPNKLPSGQLVFACRRPNSFAFAIDDGDPTLAQEVMEIVKSENINVTFFTVGLPLEDPTTNLSVVYRDMQARGHQIALHSFTHPKMEGLADYAAIDWEYNNDVASVARTFDGMHTPYFRPPFGTEGARMRQRLAVALNVSDPYVVMWSVDVEDWLWGLSSTPEKQLDAFKRDVAQGGNLVVMHYLYPNTVKYLRQFIRLAKATGKQLMRVDQCMMDPRAPPL